MPYRRTDTASQQNSDHLTGEPIVGVAQLIQACLFFIIWIADSFFFQYTTFLNHCVSLYIRIPLGIGLLIFSAYLAQKALSIVFGEKKDKPAIIREGVFAAIRHPIYLSEILLYLAFIILSISLASIAVWIIIIVFLYLVSRREENQLVTRFGDEYRQYMKDVPMWIPGFHRN